MLDRTDLQIDLEPTTSSGRDAAAPGEDVMMDTGEWIALWALLVAAAAFIVSSVIAAVAAWWSARSARAGERSALAAQTSADHAGDAVALARQQLVLARQVRDDRDDPTFEIMLTSRDRPGHWEISATMTDGPPFVVVQLSFSGTQSFAWPTPAIRRGREVDSEPGDVRRQEMSVGDPLHRLVVVDPHIQRLRLTIVLVCIESKVEESRLRRTWPVVRSRTSDHPSPVPWTPPAQ